MGRYAGKICLKHPELNGARFESNSKCVRCHMDYNNNYKKTAIQKNRIREYVRAREQKGGPGYESKKLRNKKWYKSNTGWRREYNIKRRGLGGDWVGYKDDIKIIYADTPEGCHVDHIVPLKGIDPVTKMHVVCGLHVPWNLQYLTGEENDRKWAWFSLNT